MFPLGTRALRFRNKTPLKRYNERKWSQTRWRRKGSHASPPGYLEYFNWSYRDNSELLIRILQDGNSQVFKMTFWMHLVDWCPLWLAFPTPTVLDPEPLPFAHTCKAVVPRDTCSLQDDHLGDCLWPSQVSPAFHGLFNQQGFCCRQEAIWGHRDSWESIDNHLLPPHVNRQHDKEKGIAIGTGKF